jgi:hypothetical protein
MNIRKKRKKKNYFCVVETTSNIGVLKRRSFEGEKRQGKAKTYCIRKLHIDDFEMTVVMKFETLLGTRAISIGTVSCLLLDKLFLLELKCVMRHTYSTFNDIRDILDISPFTNILYIL